MSRKKTHDEFLKELYTKNKHHMVVLEQYNGLHTKIKVRFTSCGHIREMKPSKLLMGQGCGHKECFSKRISDNKIIHNTNDKVKDLENMGYELLSDYRGLKYKIKVKNKKCGHVYEANTGNILSGSGCPKCHGIISNTQEYIDKLESKYPGEYEILGEYIRGIQAVLTKHKACGYEWECTPKSLMKDIRCPNCIKSKGEIHVENILLSMGVDYETQYIFDDCRKILPLRFDFAIRVDNVLKLIEFDGAQHFRQGNNWGGDFDYVIERDEIKNDYCNQNKIPLLRIPYWWIRNDRCERELIKFLQSERSTTIENNVDCE